jgi:carnitine O-acetyltransferase
MSDLYTRYCGVAAASLDRDSLVREDRRLTHPAATELRVIGLDVAKSATQYGVSAGYLDGAVCADLESADPTGEQRHLLLADIVISTGCLGYVTHRTIARLVDATEGQRPWMAHFAVRTFSFRDIERVLADRGYRTCQIGGPFRQRRFASVEEQSWALDVLRTSGVDPSGWESDGWMAANFYVSLPEGDEQFPASS